MFKITDFSPLINDSALYPGVDHRFAPGTITCVLGHSGSGKTSLFRALSGKLRHTGHTDIDQRLIYNVFQGHEQLLPWYTIRKNLDLACDRPWQDLCQAWSLDHLLENRPDEISVGQRQRFTLIRAICNSRPIVFCDEPLSAVDGITARSIAMDFRQMIVESKKTCLWITHNLNEASILADCALIISHDGVNTINSFDDIDDVLGYF
jgi:NitT/TauT family transport system ATP-binding protein